MKLARTPSAQASCFGLLEDWFEDLITLRSKHFGGYIIRHGGRLLVELLKRHTGLRNEAAFEINFSFSYGVIISA